MQSKLAALDATKAYIYIPTKLIKLASDLLSAPLTQIFNESIESGVVPEIFKISRVTPIYKNGAATDMANYRPISVITPFSKVLERIAYDQLISYIEKHNILYNFQFGFRKGFCTEYAILETVENLKTAIHNSQITCGIFLDFSKAFDTVNHKILLDKLFKYGIRGIPRQWFTNYLSNRQQYVKINDSESSLMDITCGIPQGSTLSPLLFLLYINDLPKCSTKLHFRIFADDTNIFFSSNNPKELENIINDEMENVLQYCILNRLSINFKKTNYMIVATPRKKVNINITVCNIQRKSQLKYLGVFIDDHLQWGAQIQHANNKIAKNTGIIVKLRHYLPLSILKQLYYNIIFPYLNYGLMSWGSAAKTRLSTLKTKQNKCIRIMFFASRYESATPYFNLLQILKLENLFKLKWSILVFKINASKETLPPSFTNLIKHVTDIHPYNTRYAAAQNLYRPASFQK